MSACLGTFNPHEPPENCLAFPLLVYRAVRLGLRGLCIYLWDKVKSRAGRERQGGKELGKARGKEEKSRAERGARRKRVQ